MFKGIGKLTKLVFRHQRLRIILWLVGLMVVTLAAASSYSSIYPDDQAKQAFAMTMQNPAMIAMLGLGYPTEAYTTIGVLFSHEMLLFSAIAVAIMNCLLIGRSTRVDEEDGRTEMIRALPVGRLSYLSSSIIVILITNLLLAVLTGSGLYALGIDGGNLESTLLYGTNLAATGMVFAGLTTVFAQLAETSRGTTMLSFTALITAYIVRAIGDVSNESLSLFSPLGWTVRTEVFVNNNWWPVYLSLSTAILLFLFAFYLHAFRDLAAGFIPTKPGRKYASALLQTPIGLILKLQRTNIVGWAIGMFVLSASFGFILGDLESYFADLEIMEVFLSSDSNTTLTNQFIAMTIAIMSLISAAPAIMVMLTIKGEEKKNRTENFYSRAISRTHLLGCYYLIAIMISIVMQILIAIGLWIGAVNVMEDTLSFGTVLASVLVFLPALWICVAVAVLLIGIIPKVTSLTWLYLIFGFIVLYLGELLEFPEWINTLSAFDHAPQLFIEDMDYLKISATLLIGIALSIIGFIGYNRRDLEG